VADWASAGFGVQLEPTGWQSLGLQHDAAFGHSLAIVGDLSGDGLDDVVVAAPDWDDSLTDEGAIFLLSGGTTPTTTWSVTGGEVSARLGVSLAVGDLNGDQVADLVAGAPGWSAASDQQGAILAFFGTSDPLVPFPATPSWTYLGSTPGAAVGSSLAIAEVDADGFGDLVAGAPGAGSSGEGEALLFSGSSAGPSAVPDWTVLGGQDAAALGTWVAAPGDVDGDGFGDIAVGAPGFDGTAADVGFVALFSGSSLGLAASANWLKEGSAAGEALGAQVAAAGDVDADGFADLLIASGEPESIGQGTASVFLGGTGGPGSEPSWTWAPDAGGPVAVFAGGDANRDGYADIVVGTPAAGEGAAFLFSGSPTGPSTEPTASASGLAPGDGFGGAVSAPADLDGDGHFELVVGAPASAGEGVVVALGGLDPGMSMEPGWVMHGTQQEAWFAWSLDAAGDLNGDGYDDIVVGAPRWDDTLPQEGAAFVFLGSADGPPASSDWMAVGGQSGARFGHTVASAGDVNADGFDDLLVGAYRWDAADPDSGAAFVFHGSAAGLGSTADWTYTGQLGEGLGSGLAAAGDVNGDGCGDVLVGARFFSDPEETEGAVYLFDGSATGLASAWSWRFQGDAPSSNLGLSMAGQDDLNGDGFADVVLGAYDWALPTETEGGRIWVFLGSAEGLPPSPAWVWSGTEAGDLLGHQLGRTGDSDGDGLGDLFVGAPGADAGPGNNNGELLWFDGGAGGPASAPLWSYLGEASDGLLGFATTGAGDLDGDGLGDLAALVANWWGPALDGGAAILTFPGGPAGPPPSPIWASAPPSDGQSIGPVARAAGDVNGDGFGDLMVGSSDWQQAEIGSVGRVRLHYGHRSDDIEAAWNPAPRALQAGTSVPIRPWTRSNSTDSFDVAVLARPPLGRTRAGLEIEAKPAGTPFDGTGLILPPTWSDTGPDGTQIQTTVDGLAGQTRYHWRVRVAHDLAQGPAVLHSAWLYGGLSGDAQGTHLVTACSGDADGDLLCDGIDPDGDNDGFPDEDDCEPFDATVNPDGAEVADDGVDQDCSGADLVTCWTDADGDGHGTEPTVFDPDGDCSGAGQAPAGQDCDDSDAAVSPGADETPDDEVDQDCNGVDATSCNLDSDGDGWGGATTVVDPDGDCEDVEGQTSITGDCNDEDASVHPDAEEVCNDLDDNCNEKVDEGLEHYPAYPDGDSDGFGGPSATPGENLVCALPPGALATNEDCNDDDPDVHPGAEELCNGIDDDCDDVLGPDEPLCGDCGCRVSAPRAPTPLLMIASIWIIGRRRRL